MQEYYLEYLKMWLRWIKPTSPFIASISFITMIGGLLAWLVTRELNLTDIPQLISFIIFLTGLSGSIIMLLFVAPYQMWKSAAPEVVKEQMHNEKQYVFPYVRALNASPVINANERYLSLSLYFPTSLTKELEISPFIQLTLNGSNSEQVQIGKVIISWRYVCRLADLHIPLTSQMVNIVKKSVEDNTPVHISLKIYTEDKRYYWETEEWTTLLLTRVN